MKVFDSPDKSVVFREISELIEKENLAELKAILDKHHPSDVKLWLGRLDLKEAASLLSLIRHKTLSRAFGRLGPARQQDIIEEMSGEAVRNLLNRLAVDDLTVFLSRLPDNQKKKYLQDVKGSLGQQVKYQLSFPPESVGRIMTPSYFRVRREWTIEETISSLNEQGIESETIKTVYVTEDDGTLIDELPIRKIVLSDPEMRIEELMDQMTITLSPEEDREIAVEMMELHDEYVLPVVDDERKMLGVVTMDDIMKFAQWEETEDFQMFGGSLPLGTSYFSTSLWRLAQKRFAPLMLLFLAGSLSSGIIGFFENKIEAMVLLTFFIPLLIGTGGNAGSQTVTTIIRALALGEVRIEQIFKVAYREVMVGILLGLLLGMVGFLFVYFYWQQPVGVAMVVSLSLPAICIMANLVAAVIPLMIEKSGLDPAVVSAPVITTFIDVGGLIVYFLIAMAVLKI